MLRSLPVEDPERLVQVRSSGGSAFTNPIWEEIRDHQQAFSGTAAYNDDHFDLADGGEKQPANGLWVSGDFFNVLGVRALRGRVFTNDDDKHGGGRFGPVAVISYAFWQARFGGDPNVLGRTIKLDRRGFEIVGVTPPWFTGLNVDRGYDVAIPIGCEPILHTDRSALAHRSWWWLTILARLQPAGTLQQAEAQLNSIAPEIQRATVSELWGPQSKKEYLRRTFDLHPAAVGFSEARVRYGKALIVLMAVVGLVLLIACANVANLLLARAAARHREISVRMAIGAGRRRVIRQLLTESLLLSTIGAAGGLLFARAGSRLLIYMLSTSQNPLQIDLSADLRVLAFTAGIAILTGILFGLAPALQATGISSTQFLKENARGAIAGSSRFRLSKLLVAAQVMLSLVLLAGAGLFLGTIRNLLTLDAGFNPQNVLLVQTDTLARVPKEQRNDLYRTILERLRAIPGVNAASTSMITPISYRGWNDVVFPEGYRSESQKDTLTYFNRISPDYFRTMGTALLMGRDFNEHDTTGSPNVMIIGESAARRFFSGTNPVGKTIALGVIEKPGVRENYQVIGVAKDSKYLTLREETRLTAYLSAEQDPDPPSSISFEVRSNLSPNSLTPLIRQTLTEVNRDLSVEFRSFETQVNDSLLQERTVALLSSFFGALALLLAAIGLYGVTSYSVTRRKSEIGIRMAVGATQQSVVWLVLRDVAILLGIGGIFGVAASLGSGRLVSSLLYGVTPSDPVNLAIAFLVLATATGIAGYLPARRASRLDPMAALREE
jgi:predicted permease